MKISSQEESSSRMPPRVLCQFWHSLCWEHLSSRPVAMMMTKRAVALSVQVAASLPALVTAMVVALTTVTACVVVTAGLTANQSTRVNPN